MTRNPTRVRCLLSCILISSLVAAAVAADDEKKEITIRIENGEVQIDQDGPVVEHLRQQLLEQLGDIDGKVEIEVKGELDDVRLRELMPRIMRAAQEKNRSLERMKALTGGKGAADKSARVLFLDKEGNVQTLEGGGISWVPDVDGQKNLRLMIEADGSAIQATHRLGIGVGGTAGIVISMVEDGSAAEEAGLQTDDVILKANGKLVSDVSALIRQVNEAGAAGEALKVLFVRGDDVESVHITPRPVPQAEADDKAKMEIEERIERESMGQLKEEIAELREMLREMKRALKDRD